MRSLTITTSEKREVVDITRIINDHLIKSGYERGVCSLFLSHTTCALTIADLDPGTDQDYLDALEAMLPRLSYRHPHDPSHFRDHLASFILGVSLTIPVESATMVLGHWQKVVLIEFNGPKERHLTLAFIPEQK